MRARNREALYSLSRTFERCAGKRARRSGAAERPVPQASSDPAAPAERLSDAGAPGTAGAEPDAGGRARDGKALPCASNGHATAAQPAAHEFTLRPLDSRLEHAKRLGQAAAEAPDLAPSAVAGEPAAGGAEAAVLPPKVRPQRRKADAGAAGPLAGGAAGKAVLGSKRKAAAADGAGGEAVVSGPSGAAREAEADEASTLAGGRDAGAAALALPMDALALDEGAGGAPAAAAPKPGKKKRRAQAKADAAAGAAGGAATTALTGGAGDGSLAARSGPARAEPVMASSAAPASPSAHDESGAKAPAAEAETPEDMVRAAGSAGGGATAAAAAAAAAACKKRVKFALSRNLAHSFGAPAPPPAVRTPPGAQPKGSALKHGAEGSRVFLGSAPGRLDGGSAGAFEAGSGQSRLGVKPGGTPRRLAARSPKSLPRAQAAQFF